MFSSKPKFPILFLGTQMEVAGAQRVLLSQADWFASHGYPVQAVFFYDKQGLTSTWQAGRTFPVFSLGAWRTSFSFVKPFLLLRGLWRLYRLLRKGIVAIVTFTPHSNLLGLPIAWIARVPLRIGTHHGYIEGSSSRLAQLHGWLTNSRLCTKIVAVSAQVEDYALKKEGVRSERLVIIENGVEPLKINSLSDVERKSLRDQIGVSKNELMLLTVGRLTLQKGHTVLLDAIAITNAKAHGVFVFAGDGPQRKHLEIKAIDLGVSERVRFLGVRDDVNKLLLSSDIFVQPSLWEGLSLALLEALLAGLPVLATRVEGVVDVVEDEQTALLVPPGDASGLAANIQRLVDDAGLRERLGSAGKRRAETRYSVDRMCQAYEALMQDLFRYAK